MPLQRVHDGRFQFFGDLTADDVRPLVADETLCVVQTCEQVAPAVAALLDRELFAARPDVTLRLYARSEPTDLAFLKGMPNVRRFAADTLAAATSTEAIAGLSRLEHLTFGVYDSTSFAFLDGVSLELKTLGLCATRSRKPTVAHVRRFPNLQELYVEGHTKGLDAIGELPRLSELRLRRVSLPGLDVLKRCHALERLRMAWGRITDLSACSDLPALRRLSLGAVRGVASVEALASIPQLEALSLEAMSAIASLSPLGACRTLRRLYVIGLKGLREIAGLERARALEELDISDAPKLPIAEVADVLRASAVRRAAIHLGTDRANRVMEKLATELGLGEPSYDR